MKRKVMLYIAMSLDGYIATEDDNLDFLSGVETPGEDYGHADFLRNIDTIIWGRRTYDKVLSFGIAFPYRDKAVWVLSKTRSGSDENVTYFHDVKTLIKQLQQQPGKDIYCDGGGQAVFELLSNGLIDRLVVSIIPHLLGSGKRLFLDGRPVQSLKFKKSITYPSGLVQLWYDKEMNSGELA